jgi:UPF0716 family protein affecting phage T7 exclusion
MIKNLLTTVLVFFIGAFTLVFTAVVGVIMAIVALIAKPFLRLWFKKKVGEYQESNYSASHSASSDTNHGRTIDGEFEDVTARR